MSPARKVQARAVSLRAAAEARLGKGGRTHAGSAEELLYELQVHQVELETQNEALRQNQIALEDARQRYLDLFEFAPVGYLTLSNVGIIAEINLTACSLLGMDRNHLLRRQFTSLVVAEDQHRAMALLVGVREGRGMGCVEVQMQRGDGALFHAQLDCARSEGSALGVSVALSDTSQRVRAERKLRESEMRWQFAVESHGDAMWDWEADKDQLFLTAAARELFNLPGSDARRPLADLIARLVEEDRLVVQAQIADVMAGKSSEWLGKCRLLSAEGAPRWITTSGRVMSRDADGRPQRIVSISRDITQSNLREAEARRQRELVAQQGRLVLLGELASVLTHEINQPLTAIAGFAAACARKVAAIPEALELVRVIEEQALRAGEIAWRMRGFARRQRTARSSLSLPEVAAGVVKWALIDTAHGDVLIDISGVDASLPQVSADRVELEQVLFNLVKNGIEATPPAAEARRIAIAAHPAQRPGEIEVSVTDWGCGLPADADFETFAPFVSSKALGLGLGLTICSSIIEAHGSHLWATTNPSGGTIFHFTLPMTDADRQTPDAVMP